MKNYLLDISKAPVPKSVDQLVERGWLAVHSRMTQLPRDHDGLAELHAIIVAERRNRKREIVLHRVYRAFNALRMELEEQQLYA